jgi:predicted ATPase/transcriptional regulator with XRE-family HTH domain
LADSFGDLLRRFRVAASLTQEALAEQCRISPATVAAIEQGRRTAPRLSTVRLIADALDLSPADRELLALAADQGGGSPKPGPEPPSRAEPPKVAAARQAGVVAGLPATRTNFVGRDGVLASVLAALDGTSVVSLVGPGGVGKTRLAAKAAELAAASYPSGAAFADLVPVREGFISQSVAALLGVAEGPGRSLDAALHEHLARGRALLVLDNCEHLLDVVAPFVEKLLANCGELTVLATSRERLSIPGEVVITVPPLSLVNGRSPGSARSEAEALFVDRAMATDPRFAGADEVISQVCARLDGIPLAIELAAARSASLGVDGLLAGLDDHLRLLAGSRGAHERHRSLRAVIDWSHDLLDDDERVMFRRVGVFIGGFDLDAAVAVAGPGRDSDRGAVADLVGRLTDKSLLIHRHGPEGSRWQMLETIRAYAVDRLSDSDEETAIRDAHLRWAAEVAADLERRVEADRPWRAAFDTVADDLRAALLTRAPYTAHGADAGYGAGGPRGAGSGRGSDAGRGADAGYGAGSPRGAGSGRGSDAGHGGDAGFGAGSPRGVSTGRGSDAGGGVDAAPGASVVYGAGAARGAGTTYRAGVASGADAVRWPGGVVGAGQVAGVLALRHRLARSLGHLAYARRFMNEACEHYRTAATLTAAPAQAAFDLRMAADVAMATGRGQQAFDLLIASAQQSDAAGDRAGRAAAIGYAVTIADRFAAEFPAEIPHDRLQAMLEEAAERCPAFAPVAAAHLAAAAAWIAQTEKTVPELDLATQALQAARLTADPVLISGALDAVVGALDAGGRLREAHQVNAERVELLKRLPRHDPRAGVEIIDAFHMVTEIAVTAGDLPAALNTATLAAGDDIASGQPHRTASKPVLPLALQGRFDEAFTAAQTMWEAWLAAGRPVARWMGPAIYGVVLGYGLRGQDESRRDWLGRLDELIGTGGDPANLFWAAMFADARIALHENQLDLAVTAVRDLNVARQAWYEAPHWYSLRPYAWAIAAEVAVVAGLPDAASLLEEAAPAGAENYWAGACLARAAGRLHGDQAELERSIAGWERIGARFERACTLLLLPDRAAEGLAELTDLGCRPPAD